MTVQQIIQQNPQLAAVAREQLEQVLRMAEELGASLLPERGEAYILPVTNRETGKVEARLLLGYRYYVRLGYETGIVRLIRDGIVYDGDEFEIELGSSPRVFHRPQFRSVVPVVYYVDVLTGNGEHIVKAMGAEEARLLREQRLSASRSRRSPWASDEHWHGMILKTLLRRAYRYMYLPPVLAKAMHLEDVQQSAEA